VYEDVTCGQLAERLQSASTEEFSAGFICNTEPAIKALLVNCRNHEKLEAILADPTRLADELASSVRAQSGSDFGLALHAVTDPDRKIQNLARGQMYISLADGKRILRRESTTAGRGAYDRSRMTLNALDLLRAALLGRTE